MVLRLGWFGRLVFLSRLGWFLDRYRRILCGSLIGLARLVVMRGTIMLSVYVTGLFLFISYFRSAMISVLAGWVPAFLFACLFWCGFRLGCICRLIFFSGVRSFHWFWHVVLVVHGCLLGTFPCVVAPRGVALMPALVLIRTFVSIVAHLILQACTSRHLWQVIWQPAYFQEATSVEASLCVIFS